MRRWLLIAWILLFAGAAPAQEADPNEVQFINEIAQCMVSGLPEDWVAAHMVVELAAPGDSTGQVRFLFARKDAEDKLEHFTPCDTDQPPRLLVALRDRQPPARRGWTSARLSFGRDGGFRVNYDFPK